MINYKKRRKTKLKAINPNVVVPISTSMIQAPQGAGILAGCCLTTNPLIPTTTPVMQFIDADSVGAYFGTTSNEYAQALIYFTAPDQATINPPYMYFAGYINEAVAPYIRSQALANSAQLLTSLSAITAGTFTFTSNGTVYTTTGITLATATSLSQVASLLQAAIIKANATLTTLEISYSGTLNYFEISNGVTGSASTMGFATDTPLSVLMGLTQDTGAYLSQGSDSMSPAQNMTLLADYLMDTATIFPVDNLGDATFGTTYTTFMGLAQWISTQSNNQYALLLWDNVVAETQSPDSTSLQALLNTAEYNNTAVFYDNPGLCALASSVFASSDYTEPNTATTVCFKSQAGTQPTVTSTPIAEIMLAKGTNFYGSYSLSTAGFRFLQNGAINGSYAFIDNLIAAIWIGRNIQLNLFNTFTSLNEVTNDANGYQTVETQIANVMNNCITNNIIALGQTFSIQTQQQIKSKYGISTQVLTNNGYAIISTASSELQRQQRVTPIWYVLYVKGSAIQTLPVSIAGLF